MYVGQLKFSQGSPFTWYRQNKKLSLPPSFSLAYIQLSMVKTRSRKRADYLICYVNGVWPLIRSNRNINIKSILKKYCLRLKLSGETGYSIYPSYSNTHDYSSDPRPGSQCHVFTRTWQMTLKHGLTISTRYWRTLFVTTKRLWTLFTLLSYRTFGY